LSDDRLGQRPIYEIRVMGRLDEKWADWFGGMDIATGSSQGSPITVLTGPVVDQAALRGLLAKIWDLNLTVTSVLLVGE